MDVAMPSKDSRGLTSQAYAVEQTTFGSPTAIKLGLIQLTVFSVLLTASWAATANGFQAGLENGGPASLTWGFMVTIPGTFLMVLSLAEMASATPSVGAQYRYTYMYCPDWLPKRFFSFVQGYLTVFAWITAATLLPFFTGSQIVGLLILSQPDYVFHGWHITLIAYAVIILPVLANIFAHIVLKPIEVLGIICTIVFFIIFVVVLCTRGGRNDASYVFFADSGGASGWTNPAVAWCIGLLSTVFPLTAFDGVLHLSAEASNPSMTVPRAMVYGYLASAFFSLTTMLVLLFFMGDPAAALSTPTGWPIIEICYQATGTITGAVLLMATIIILGIVSYFNGMASVIRLTRAFAHDGGLPYGAWLRIMHPRLGIPLHATLWTTAITMMLLLIPIGSEVAFDAVVSLSTVAFQLSYLLPCILMFSRRLAGNDVRPTVWNLGKWGIWVNGGASLYGLFVFAWLLFPPLLPVSAANLNWAGPIVGLVILLSLIDWVVRGKKVYHLRAEELL